MEMLRGWAEWISYKINVPVMVAYGMMGAGVLIVVAAVWELVSGRWGM